VQPPPEFRLVAACCRWPADARAVDAFAPRAGALDWDLFLGIVARHRVDGLVHHALRLSALQPPPAVEAGLAAAARGIARQNLLFAAESRRLAQALDAAGLCFLFVKGVTLDMLAYGTLALKRAADIDLAVDPADYLEAAAVVRACGYRCAVPGEEAGEEELLRAVRLNKHSAWKRDGLYLEMHYQLVDSPRMLSAVSVRSPRQQVAIAPGLTLPTLADDELFAYLCVHGATHAWARLKWLADVNAFLGHADEAELERLYERSLELGGGRSAGQALLLCADLLGCRLPERLERRLRGDRALRYLARVGLSTMVKGGADVELDDQVLGTAAIHLSHLRLMPGWRFKAAEVRRKVAPGDSGPLAPLLAGPRWLLRRARRARLWKGASA
jgi:putative nucleotidyltransferase-like protein